MPESWNDYGYPDDLTLKTAYLPTVALIKALNERRAAVNMEPLIVPDYFSPWPGPQSFLADFDFALNATVPHFVNPDAVSSATSYSGCFWWYEDLELAAVGGDPAKVYHRNPLQPEFCLKWALQRYAEINLLRYVATTTESDWPTFNYEDINDTFNFKA